MNGYGLCLWCLKRFAAAIFTRMLRLNPYDSQRARFNLHEIRAGQEWQECDEKWTYWQSTDPAEPATSLLG